MKRTLIALLAVALLTAADAPGDEAAKKDLELMQGDWAAVTMIKDGFKYEDNDAQAYFRTVKGSDYSVFRFNKMLGKGTFKLDATKKPKAIDFLPATASGPGKPLLGIYEINGDTYKICYTPPEKERPTDFSAGEGTGHTLTVWEREKK
jgi:uncharacterized protein (TIGR03067 family)